MAALRVAVVGATGAVGREMVRILEERSFPVAELALFASPRSEGTRVPFAGDHVAVRALGDGWSRGVDLALVSAGAAVSREVLPRAAAEGTVCVDNSSAFRMDPAVPLVIPEVNPEALRGHRGIVANPNCTAITALLPLAPLHRAFGLELLVTSSYQAASGAGMKGVRELAEQVERLRGREEALGRPDPSSLPVGRVFPRTLAFNVVPWCERADPEGTGFTTEELKMGNEARKILGLPELAVAATAVRVPTVTGHGVAVYAQFARPLTPSAAREVLASAPGVRLVDDPAAPAFPTPLDAAGRDEVLVGRVRQPPGDQRGLLFFACGDNLRKGAALNAVQIAERLVGMGLLAVGSSARA
jgi:aspartate-semialdehyde dehydrogenase